MVVPRRCHPRTAVDAGHTLKAATGCARRGLTDWSSAKADLGLSEEILTVCAGREPNGSGARREFLGPGARKRGKPRSGRAGHLSIATRPAGLGSNRGKFAVPSFTAAAFFGRLGHGLAAPTKLAVDSWQPCFGR
jgi:hypothetical protein